MQTQIPPLQIQDFETETHFCAGCGAPARLTRKERGEYGGFFLTFACARCGTKEMIKSDGGSSLAKNAAGLRRH